MPNSVCHNEKYPEINQSEKLYERIKGLVPACTQTLAKGPTQYVNGVAPKFLQRGKGARVWDVDGNEYLDFNMGIGPVSLGYCYDRVDEAVKAQLAEGISFSLVHPLELEVAELIREVIPNAESVRYSKTGADVTSAAVRVARAYTGRNKVLCCGYHGWHDWYIGVTPRKAGVPGAVQDMVHTFQYNDLDSVERSLDSDTACVILEPMVFEMPQNGFLEALKALCVKNGTLLIFDEMWTGFRLATGGAQEAFSVTADLACFSKAVANGMPVSLLTGRQDVMQLFDETVFFFTTFGGEALSLAAVKATINEIREKDVSAYLARQGQKLKDGYNQMMDALDMKAYSECSGHPSRTIITFKTAAGDPLLARSFLQQEMIRHGILWSGFHNVCFSHRDEDVDYTLEVYRQILPELKEAIQENNLEKLLKGEPVQPVFRKTNDFDTKPAQSR